MKAIINNLTEQAIEVDFGTERVYRDLAKDKPDIIYCYELTKLNIPSNYSIRDNLEWLFELDSITNIKLYALDTRSERIRVEYNENHYEGKNTDRSYATFTCKYQLTKEQENILINEFNKQIEAFRKQYFDLSLTNYRDYNRKRISFTFAYQLLSKIYNETYGQNN